MLMYGCLEVMGRRHRGLLGGLEPMNMDHTGRRVQGAYSLGGILAFSIDI